MKTRKEIVILSLIIVGLSLYLALRSEDRTHFELPRIAAIEPKAIDRVVFKKGETVIELNRKDDAWFVGEKSYRADDATVRNMVKAVADLTLTALVSESGNYDRYDLTETSKTTIRAYSGGDAVRNFDVGKGAPTFQHSFVRLEKDANVYHARGRIHELFDATVAELRDETVLDIAPPDVTAVVIQKGDRTRTLTKSAAATDEKRDDQANRQAPEPQWATDAGGMVDAAIVSEFLREFKQFKCSDYMADDAKAALTDPIWRIRFETSAATHQLSVFALPDAEAIEHPATASGSDYAFYLTKSRVEGLAAQLDKILGETASDP